MRPLSPYEVRAPKADGAGVIDDLMPSQEDLLYEEELLRNPYSLKMWVRYIQARQDAPAKRRYLLYERALKSLPGSYKVCWSEYAQLHITSTLSLMSACAQMPKAIVKRMLQSIASKPDNICHG